MDATISMNPCAVTAVYRKELIPQYRGNPLIEALPPSLDEEQLLESLFSMPAFDPEQRTWPAHLRYKMIIRLSDFMLPLERHIRLGFAIDTLIRDGYVGRIPRTAPHVAVLQQLYEARQAGNILRADGYDEQNFAQKSSSFIGIAGIGKTAILRYLLRYYPAAIYHPELGITQITYLHIEAPHDGMSVKGLCDSIRRKIESLVPDITPKLGYKYGSDTSESRAMNYIARLMHISSVGLLIVDEIQNLKNAIKGKKRNLLALLVGASNELGVPILFVGTNRAASLLGLDFSPGRRAVGSGFTPWNALTASHSILNKDRGEWEYFASGFWNLQWVREPTALTQELSDALFEHCQGIVDIALNLFACVQWEAILDGSETITVQGIHHAWRNTFVILHKMIDAYRSGIKTALEQYQDIAPINFQTLADATEAHYRGARNLIATSEQSRELFVPAITSALMERGFEANHALALVKKVQNEGKVKNVAEGIAAALALTMAPTRHARRTSVARKDVPSVLGADDYRNAIASAKAESCTIFSKLCEMGAVLDLNQFIGEG